MRAFLSRFDFFIFSKLKQFNSTLNYYFQLIIKICAVYYDEKLRWMVNFILDIYKQNIPSKNPKRIEIFQFYSMATEYTFKIGIFLYAISVLGYFVNPVFGFYFEGKIEMMLPLYIPQVDSSTYRGYIIHFGFHLALLIFAFLGSTCADFLFTMIIMNSPIVAGLISDEVDALNTNLSDMHSNKFEHRQRFRNILQMAREYTT